MIAVCSTVPRLAGCRGNVQLSGHWQKLHYASELVHPDAVWYHAHFPSSDEGARLRAPKPLHEPSVVQSEDLPHRELLRPRPSARQWSRRPLMS